MSRGTRPLPKDMYWFAHGGPENEKNPHQRNSVLIDGEEDASNSPTWNTVERRASPDEQRSAQNVTDGSNYSSGPASLERDDRLRISNKHLAVEERRRQLWEAEQERNDAVLKKHMERDAALEARRNASRSTIAFAFGSSVPRNVDTIQGHEGGDADIMSRSFTCGSSHRGEDVMSRSMTVSAAPRGRRKNDLMPTIPYERDRTINTSRVATSSSTRKRSVSMTRLDQLALPRKHYVEANKASSTNTSMHKDNVKSPQRPLSSASENSGGSGRAPGNVTRRVRSTPRKPRPVSIAGTLPEQRQVNNSKPFEVKATPIKKTYTPSKLSATAHSTTKTFTPKPVEKAKQTPCLSTPPKINTPKPSTPRTTSRKPSTPRTPKPTENKTLTAAKPVSSPKTPVSKVTEKKPLSAKKKPDAVVAAPLTGEVRSQVEDNVNSGSPPPSLDADVAAENEKNNAKRIISEEEARAALAEKRRLAREQAEKEAELERQRMEQLRLEEEERLRQEEEEHKKMEEEQMRLLEEHRRQEEEKLRKAIEDQEQRAEEERAKRDEEMRLKAEQEKKAKEEAEKQRIELEEKLRKEEEERAERKKRLEKIMSRTRGKSSGLSPSGSMSGSDHLDSGENHQEGFSSGANSLESNEGDLQSEQVSTEDQKAEISLEAKYEIGSENESLNSNDLMMPGSETASQDNSLVGLSDKVPVASAENEESAAFLSSPPTDDVKGVQESPKISESVGDPTVEVTEITGMEEMMKSVMVEPSFAQENGSNPGSEIDSQGNLEVKQEFPEVLPPTEFAHESQNQDFGDADPFLQVGSQDLKDQQDLKKFEELQNLSGENESNQLVTSEEASSEHDMNLENIPTTVPFSEEVNMEMPTLDSEMFENQGSSVASDLKLPDPIYETSEDGSISSEKQMFRMQEDFDDARNQENVLDDVVPLPDPASAPLSENPFEMNAFNANPFSDNYSASRSNIDSNESAPFDMSGSICEVRESNTFSQEHENQEITESSLSPNLVEPDVHQNEREMVEEVHNSENTEQIPAAIIYDVSLPHPVEEFHNGELQNGHHNYEESSIFDNQLIQNKVSDSLRSSESDELAINNQPLQESQSNQVTDQAVTENKSDIFTAFNHEETNDVTLIKADNDGACVGIISSIDHDQVSNDFPKPNLLDEQFRNNFQSASMTDSEDNSSLDSNQSQVMTAGDSEKCVVEGLNHMDISESTKNGYSNGEKHNPFDIGNMYNDSLSKSSVNNFHASEMYGNGHRSSQSASEQMGELPGYLHSSGNGLLSVDKNNIFESAAAFGKVSPDPFLVKGSSNQNPFLLQDDQKQAFVAPDFLN
ncbi:hypothetical protein JTE90_014603 [Oedothorax gibbosus]|uniref:Uncharacterized protein n=1 Tax=Oedothorax gibbosus TaxID=931172 RepID=A0AAV6V884_9ARAC|nr:hypothetical protein JTE90_014603 [Oedothorax gibbosus]